MNKRKNIPVKDHYREDNKSSYLQDYEMLMKYQNLDLNNIIDWADILSDLRKDCFIIEKYQHSNFINQFFAKSFIGNVTLAKIDEKWPIYDGEYLIPILQLYIKDLPQIPDILSDIEYLMIFIHTEGYDPNNQDSICIRSYTKNDRLVRIKKPLDIISKSHKIKFRQASDWPSDNLHHQLIEYFNNEYYDKALENPYQCKEANKISGWPSWVESSEISQDKQFILQLNNYGHPYWDQTDCPNLYIFRNNKTHKFSASSQI